MKPAVTNFLANTVIFFLSLASLVAIGLGARLVFELVRFGWRLL